MSKTKLKKTGKGYTDWSICNIEDENGNYMKTVTAFKNDFSPNVRELWKLFESEDSSHMAIYRKTKELIGLLEFLKEDVGDYDMREYDE